MARQRNLWRLAGAPGAVVMLGALAASASAQSSDPDLACDATMLSSHVHPLNDTFDARPLLKSAVEQSPTVRRLIAALNVTDVIVYVVLCDDVRNQSADLHLMPPAPGARRVLIRVDARNPIPDRLKLLGHELRHAIEVASDPEARDSAGMTRLFRRIGRRLADGFETEEAVRVGNVVYREVLTGARKKQTPPCPREQDRLR